MIRGALILAIGFSLGYAKALQEQEEVKEVFAKVVNYLKKLEEEKDNTSTEAVEVTAVETPYAEPEGETPS